MHVFVGVILAAVFFVVEWNDVTERYARGHSCSPYVRPLWNRRVGQVAYALIASIGIALLVTLPVRSLDPLDGMIAMMFFWSGLSITWASDRTESASALGGWLSTGCAVFGVGLTSSLHQCAVIMATGCLFFLLAGVLHEYRTSRFELTSSYRFFGAIGCNRQATEASLLLYLTIFLYLTGTTSALIAAVIAFSSVSIMLLSQSRTAVSAAIVGVAAWALSSMPSGRAVMMTLGLGLIGISLIAVIPFLRNRLLSILLLGRKRSELSSLSGRTPIWSLMWPTVRQHPICGSGYGSVWNEERHRAICDVHIFPVRVVHAHNVYLESLLNGGVIALMLLMSVFSLAMWYAIHTGSPTGPMICGIVTLAAVQGISESRWALPYHCAFVFFAILVAIPN